MPKLDETKYGHSAISEGSYPHPAEVQLCISDDGADGRTRGSLSVR